MPNPNVIHVKPEDIQALAEDLYPMGHGAVDCTGRMDLQELERRDAAGYVVARRHSLRVFYLLEIEEEKRSVALAIAEKKHLEAKEIAETDRFELTTELERERRLQNAEIKSEKVQREAMAQAVLEEEKARQDRETSSAQHEARIAAIRRHERLKEKKLEVKLASQRKTRHHHDGTRHPRPTPTKSELHERLMGDLCRKIELLQKHQQIELLELQHTEDVGTREEHLDLLRNPGKRRALEEEKEQRFYEEKKAKAKSKVRAHRAISEGVIEALNEANDDLKRRLEVDEIDQDMHDDISSDLAGLGRDLMLQEGEEYTQ